MKKKAQPEQLYALFHVNINTGQKVRFRIGGEATSRHNAETRAADCRIGKMMGCAYNNGWSVEAHPVGEICKDSK